jgi:hypothetical protein
MNEAELEDLFQSGSVVRGNLRFFDLDNARAFIDAAADNDIAVIGVEGFNLTSNDTIPLIDLVGDFSDAPSANWNQFRDATRASAKRFVDSITDGRVFVVFTLTDRRRWLARSTRT